MAALLPIYLKHYKNEALFSELKLLLLFTVNVLKVSLNAMANQIKMDGVPSEAITG
jgi:hypothetical protein